MTSEKTKLSDDVVPATVMDGDADDPMSLDEANSASAIDPSGFRTRAAAARQWLKSTVPSREGSTLSDANLPESEGLDDEQLRKNVKRERDELREFVSELSGDDIKSGNWFAKLLSHALRSYTEKVNWEYFQDKYDGVPPDAIVDQRIKMAARYAAVEGGLSAGAYTAAIAATIGSGGGASPAVVPAAVATVMVDIAYLTRLQIHLAYDIAVLYRVPLDLDDPDDLWKLIRVAFTIKGGEVVREGALKAVPAVVRPLLKRFYSGPVLAAAKGLPVVGKYLLQRNIIKIGIPLVGVPLAVLVNLYTTKVTGRHARSIFRNDARVADVAGRLSKSTRHPRLLLWVSWLVVMADGSISDDEAMLMKILVRRCQEEHGVFDDELARVVDLHVDDVWRRVEAETDDLADIVIAAEQVAAVDGAIVAAERDLLIHLRERCAGRARPDDVSA